MRRMTLWMGAVALGAFVVGCRSDTPAAAAEAAHLEPLRYSRDPFSHRLDCAQPEPCVRLVLPRLVLADTQAVARRIDAWLFELMMRGLPLRKRDFNSRATYADSLFAHYQQLKGVKRALPRYPSRLRSVMRTRFASPSATRRAALRARVPRVRSRVRTPASRV